MFSLSQRRLQGDSQPSYAPNGAGRATKGRAAWLPLTAVLAAALALGACGADDSTDEESAEPAAAAVEADAPEVAANDEPAVVEPEEADQVAADAVDAAAPDDAAANNGNIDDADGDPDVDAPVAEPLADEAPEEAPADAEDGEEQEPATQDDDIEAPAPELADAPADGDAEAGDPEPAAEPEPEPAAAAEPAPEPAEADEPAPGPADAPDAPDAEDAEPDRTEADDADDTAVDAAEGEADIVDAGPAPLAADPPTLDEALMARLESADTDRGRSEAQPCVGCHSFQEGGQGRDGPQLGPILFDIFGAPIAAADDFEYSPAFAALADDELRWTAAMLDGFLADPEAAVPGTAMSFGVDDPQDRADVIAFLNTLSNNPLPIDADAEAAVAASDAGFVLVQRIADADIAAGEVAALRCSSCHRFSADAEALTGPNLYGVVGARVARVGGFDYSPALEALGESGAEWTFARLDRFLESPAVAVPGTRMGFGGVADADERAAIIAYLRTLAEEPVPLVVEDGPVVAQVGVYDEDLNPVAFSITQADFGDRYFGQFGCIDCHGARLQGVIDIRDENIGVPPALVGPNFERRWFDGTVYELFDYMRTTMPPDGAGGLEELFYADILAFILEQNGFEPGTTTLPVDRETLENMGFYQ